MPTLFVLIAGVLWSFSGILIKEIHWNAFAIAGTRSLIGGALQFCFLVFTARNASLQSQSGGASRNSFNEAFVTVAKRVVALEPVHWLGAVSFVVNMIALVWAFQLTTAANAVFLHYSGIVLVALFSLPVLKQELSRQDWLAVLGGIAGIGFISFDGLQINSLPGTVLSICCGITMATTQICLGLRIKAVRTGSAALETIVLANLLTVVLTLPAILTAPLLMPIDRAWVFLILLGIVPWGMPDILYALAIKKVPVFRALILGLSDPVLTAVWPLIFLGEVPSTLAMIGAAMILAAIVYQAKYAHRQQPCENIR